MQGVHLLKYAPKTVAKKVVEQLLLVANKRSKVLST